MARNPLAHACLLATILVAGAMPTDATRVNDLLDDVRSYPPACAASDDESGMGKTDVSCRYSCGVGTLLAIGAESADAQATVYGHTSCGGTNAICKTLGSTCRGVSDGLTEYSQPKASCYAASDEWFDSPLTVACASHSTDAESIVCALIKDLCEGETPGVPEVPGVPDVPNVPDIAPPVVLDEAELIARCESVAAKVGSAGGFVLALISAPGFTAVQYDPASGCHASSGLF